VHIASAPEYSRAILETAGCEAILHEENWKDDWHHSHIQCHVRKSQVQSIHSQRGQNPPDFWHYFLLFFGVKALARHTRRQREAKMENVEDVLFIVEEGMC
jgi:hypothetical protein